MTTNLCAKFANQVEEISRHINVSRSVLRRSSRGVLKRSVYEEILTTRIRRARESFVGTDFQLATVAERAGFKHQEYMGAVLESRLGTTPAQLRRNAVSELGRSGSQTMTSWVRGLLASIVIAVPANGHSPTIPFDSSGVRPGPVMVSSTAQSVVIQWPDEAGRTWKAEFSLNPEIPLISFISMNGARVITQAQPYYQVTAGKRRGGWDEFFDFPPGHPDGTRTFRIRLNPRSARAVSLGNRVEIAFDGLQMGIFEGSIRYVFFPHSRLVEQAAVVSTTEPDTAYIYDAGFTLSLDSDPAAGRGSGPSVSYYDTQNVVQDIPSTDPERRSLRARYRMIASATGSGSVAAFPAPHRYFFPRDFTTNQGYVWHSSLTDWPGQASVSLGIHQPPDDGTAYYPWSNAPPATEQRLSLFLLVQPGNAHASLNDVARFTNWDRFPALDGYKTFTSHWHFGYTVQAMEKGASWTPPFRSVLKAMGVDAAMIMDFHGDGHPWDAGTIRLRELQAYYEACRSQSGPDFLLIPAEEANVYFGGHWGIAFPKPVLWRMNRAPEQRYRETDSVYGTVYNVANATELLDLVRSENGFVYQTHPRTKSSAGFPDQIRQSVQFLDAHYFGAGWKAMPSDLSSPRLGERVFKLLDDMSNWGLKKRVVGEVDVFDIDRTHELYAHMNVNYVRMSALPSFERYGELLDAIRHGHFFVSTGEVLLPDAVIAAGTHGRISVRARIKHTFPLQMAEIVWGDGSQILRKTFPLTSTHPSEDVPFSADVEGGAWKWARIAVWDVAANGAFVNPVWRSN